MRGWGQQGYHTGCHFACLSILTSLLYRGESGEGQFIDVSMTAALNVTTEGASYNWLVASQTVQRQTGRHAAVAPTEPRQVRCADGRHATIGVPPRTPAEFARLLEWLRRLGLEERLPEAVFLEMGAAPYRLPRSPWRIARRAPRLGEHQDEVLGSLGPAGWAGDAPDG